MSRVPTALAEDDPLLDFTPRDHAGRREQAGVRDRAGGHRIDRDAGDQSTEGDPHTAQFFEQLVACPPSVLTARLTDQAGQPTLAARDEFLKFFSRRLRCETS